MNVGIIPPLDLHNVDMCSQIAKHLETLIMEGTLSPGVRLPSERQLATQMRVSRTTIRESLSELESKGLIERVHGRGSTVLDPLSNTIRLASMLEDSDKELQSATELRESVEPRIASLAAERAKPGHISALHDIVRQENDEHLTQDESLKLDIRFHLLLAHATGNKLLLTVLQFSFKCTEHVRELSHQNATGRRISHMGHRLIYEAIVAHNPQQAELAMIHHLSDVHDISALAR